MPKRQRLTNNSDETDIASLLSGDTVFAVPYFQRAYKWKPERLKQLNQDLLNLVDETSDFHFLGAVIIHGRRSNPSDPDTYEVIDGQQRITTLYLYLCAVVRVLAKHGEYGEAAGLFLKYLAIGRDTPLVSNAKLHSCKDDRAQLNAVIYDLLTESAFKEKVSPFQFKPLPATGSDHGRLWNNYRSALRFFEEQFEQEGIERVRAIYKAMLELMSVVQIDVWDPTNGPKIFDSLNSRQEPMTTGDLVRNEIFSRVANEHPDNIEQVDRRSWQPFYTKFRDGEVSLFDAYFFPFGLIKNPNLRKSEVYSYLRSLWSEVQDPELIIRELCGYQDAFLDVARGSNLQQHEKVVASAFRRLFDSGAPSSVYPFLMQLSDAVKRAAVTPADGEGVLNVIESFLVRRAICGHEPTGLHAVFKRLWGDCDGAPTPKLVVEAIRTHKTVVWPSAEDVETAVRKRPLYSTSIAAFVLTEHNRSLGGDPPPESSWIEHVLPASPDPDWFKTFTAEQHDRMKDLLANLLPLSQQMNQSLGNSPYGLKRAAYENDSGFKVARQFASQYSTWTPDHLEGRGAALAAWVSNRWPH